jgi:hypothetical protein
VRTIAGAGVPVARSVAGAGDDPGAHAAPNERDVLLRQPVTLGGRCMFAYKISQQRKAYENVQSPATLPAGRVSRATPVIASVREAL